MRRDYHNERPRPLVRSCSIVRSLDRSLDPLIDCLIYRPLAPSLDRLIARSIAWSIGCAIATLHACSITLLHACIRLIWNAVAACGLAWEYVEWGVVFGAGGGGKIKEEWGEGSPNCHEGVRDTSPIRVKTYVRANQLYEVFNQNCAPYCPEDMQKAIMRKHNERTPSFFQAQ